MSVRGAPRSLKVTVEAGEYGRTNTWVSIPVAAGLERYHWSKGGPKKFWAQVDGTNATFYIPALAKGAVTNLPLNPSLQPWAGLETVRAGSKLACSTVNSAEGKATTLFEYQPEPGAFPREDIKELFRRGGYLHPIRTLSGRVITDDFPPNHVHHHGVWWAWTSTEFDGRKPDFWNMGQGKGRVDFVTLESQWSGPLHGGFESRHRFVDMTGPKQVAALDENWKVTAYKPWAKDYWCFDLVSEQRCAGTNGLKLPKYHYGGLGLRGNWAWNGAGKGNILTAEGETDRVKAHAQKSRWFDMWGKIDGADCGIAVLCHPSNFRAPQPMRVHPNEPFFCYAPQQGGDMEIKPGDTYVSRYRFVVHDGPPDRNELERLWNDYAHPPVVRVRVE